MEYLKTFLNEIKKRVKSRNDFVKLVFLSVFVTIMATSIDFYIKNPNIFITLGKSFVMIVLSLLYFSVGYTIANYLSEYNKNLDPNYLTSRQRLSVKMRRRVSLVISAFLVVILINVDKTSNVYIVGTSIITTCFISLFAFIRMSKKEKEREMFDVPDYRDLEFEVLKRQQVKNKKKAKKKEKLDKLKEIEELGHEQ